VKVCYNYLFVNLELRDTFAISLSNTDGTRWYNRDCVQWTTTGASKRWDSCIEELGCCNIPYFSTLRYHTLWRAAVAQGRPSPNPSPPLLPLFLILRVAILIQFSMLILEIKGMQHPFYGYSSLLMNILSVPRYRLQQLNNIVQFIFDCNICNMRSSLKSLNVPYCQNFLTTFLQIYFKPIRSFPFFSLIFIKMTQ